jgi:cytochrome P450
MAAFGYPLPLTIICEMLGVPPSDEKLPREWPQARMLRGADRLPTRLR